MNVRRAAVLGAVVAGAVLLSPAAVSAAGPTITTVPFGGSFDNDIDCGDFGVDLAFSGERTTIDFYSGDGTLVKQIRQVEYTGTLTNSVTGTSIPYEGRFVRTQDFLAGTVSITGLQNRVLLPGQGVVALNVGRVVFGPDGESASGQHDFAAQVCAALA